MDIGDTVKFNLDRTFYGEGEITQIPLHKDYISVKLTRDCGGYLNGLEIDIQYDELIFEK